jgi:bacillaene synthase trans-acting acyltransferase
MFSGQGSQYYHMGKELYCQNNVFQQWISEINDIVYQRIGFSVIDEIYNEVKGKADSFDRLLYTHPAIFMVEYSLARVLIESGFKPDYVLGTSLGEVNSAAVAGVVSLEEALEILLKQIDLITRHCQNGSMIAIIGSPDLYSQLSMAFRYLELAAINYSSHFIVSGDTKNLSEIEGYLRNKGVVFQRLPVGYGFHSSNIIPIENEYKTFLRKFVLKKPEVPIISCSLSDFVTEFSNTYFWDIIREPICFQDIIVKLEKQGQLSILI